MKFSTMVALAGCMAACVTMADEPAKSAAPSSLQSFDASIGKIDRKLDTLIEKTDANTLAIKGVAETVGNRGADADEIKNLIKDVGNNVNELLDLLEVKGAPQLAPPLRIDAPPPEKSDQHTASSPPQLQPGFEFLADDPNFCFECNRHLWADPKAVYVPPVKSNSSSAITLSHIPGPDGTHAAADVKARFKVSAPPQQGWTTVCENGVCRRVLVAQQLPMTATRREERKAARGR